LFAELDGEKEFTSGQKSKLISIRYCQKWSEYQKASLPDKGARLESKV